MSGTNTTISVYVLALGGKFLGSKVGFATVTITGADLPAPVSGLADMDYPAGPNQDGSGVLGLIMGQPLPWGTAVRTDAAASFTTTLSLSKPALLTVTAVTSKTKSDHVSVSAQVWVVPGQNRTGANAIVLVVPGLLVVAEPTKGPAPFTATVNMMCGCVIDNLFWPAANFSVIAQLSNGAALPLGFAGSSQFSGTLPADVSVVSVTATEAINGNTGVWFAPGV
jgi:hypothetical protein